MMLKPKWFSTAIRYNVNIDGKMDSKIKESKTKINIFDKENEADK